MEYRRGRETDPARSHGTSNVWNLFDSTASDEKTQEQNATYQDYFLRNRRPKGFAAIGRLIKAIPVATATSPNISRIPNGSPSKRAASASPDIGVKK